MAEEGIFLAVDGKLQVLEQRAYDSEKVLQKALEDFPEVIAGATTDGFGLGRLLLVRREMGVPASSAGGAVWSIDHLFLDSEGTPILVEVKRSNDTRIRREVVGQMLDYAANGSVYWPVSTLRAALDTTASAAGGDKSGDDLVAEKLGRQDADEFWKNVELNLKGGRIRMVFVADEFPRELVRIIEFLNEQMNPAEVLGVELRQYRGNDGPVAYVPQVVGRTGTAIATKESSSGGLRWSEKSLLDAAEVRRPDVEVALMRRLIADVHTHGHHHGWGTGVTPGVSGWYQVGGQPSAVWNLNVNAERSGARAYLYFYLADLARRLPAERIERAAQILERIPDLKPKIVEARQKQWNKYPSIYLDQIVKSESSDADIAVIFEAIRDLTIPAQINLPTAEQVD